ncbi:hypothetical protein NDU88_001950 [Pleurodeles waltl]|uniref:Uncharacterized protein n=1 Tax=Pleurodeles waltl TaxID=8319 RepID=A0AAV7LEB7_PLEWA|nr:hypothetical protein NDU88_001950 [Pleurodeles waltl]
MWPAVFPVSSTLAEVVQLPPKFTPWCRCARADPAPLESPRAQIYFKEASALRQRPRLDRSVSGAGYLGLLMRCFRCCRQMDVSEASRRQCEGPGGISGRPLSPLSPGIVSWGSGSLCTCKVCVFRQRKRPHLPHPSHGLIMAALFSASGARGVLRFRLDVAGDRRPQRLHIGGMGVPAIQWDRSILLISGGP